ncbi:MAG: insulinase family protein, partial [Opitutales bacterium]
MSELEGLSHEQIAGPAPERRVLANGLEVIFCRRPGVGLCTVQAWVRTGSVDEGRWEGSGISHYLEHMVFKGTERFAGRELSEAIHRAGGSSNAYTTFARGGLRPEPVCIKRVVDRDGNLLEEAQPRREQVLTPYVAGQMVDLMRGAVQYGTAASASSLGHELAGKTGTVNDFTDAWFIGYTPSVVCGVWIG